jgi:hypothetical protein
MTVDARTAESFVAAALARLVDGVVVSSLRADTPLDRVPIGPPDLVVLADALADVADRAGLACDLGDADLTGIRTLGELADVVARRTTAAPGGDDAH